MIIVTGGAGFIGSNVVKALNARNTTDILVVDNLTNVEKVPNIADLQIANYFDKIEFESLLDSGESFGDITAVLHQGACSDTMATDGRYVMANNFTFSRKLYCYCQERRVPYIYASSASVYGDGDTFVEHPRHEKALNAYAWSKLLFDQFVRQQGEQDFQCVGLRYFNVYGPREQHKGRMASVAWHFSRQYRDEGHVRLFKGSGGFADGEQRRDFVSVDDIVALNLFFLDHPDVSGIFNAGTGRCRSYNDMALATINACRREEGEEALTLKEALASGSIRYVPMPEALKGRYQSFTEANLDALRETGYDAPFIDIEAGLDDFVRSGASAAN